MLKRFFHLIAAAAALTIAAAPAAEADGRQRGGYHDRDRGRHIERHRDWGEHRKWRRHARRDDHGHYWRAPRDRHYHPYRHHYSRHYSGPSIIWRPRYRHRHYSGWHHDRHYRLAILFSVLETVRTGYTRRWHDPDTQTLGYVTPTRTYQVAGGQYCREYQQQIIVGGQAVEGYGRACRQPDGSWQTVN